MTSFVYILLCKESFVLTWLPAVYYTVADKSIILLPVLIRPQIKRKQRTFQRKSMLKPEILPKTPCDIRSNFQRMRRVLKLVYINREIYYLTSKMHFAIFIAGKREKTSFFTTHPIFNFSKCVLHSLTTYQSGIQGPGGGGNRVNQAKNCK